MVVGAASVLVLSGVHALFNANFHVFGIFFLGAVMLGALLSSLPRESAPALTIPAWGRWAGIAVCAGLLVATVSTFAGVYAFDRGQRLLKAGGLSGAERAFRMAASADPFRSSYPDALSAVHYRRYLAERSSLRNVRKIPESMFEALQWEDRARDLSPRDLKYTLRLSGLFFDLFRLRGEPSDAWMSLRLADGALRINPYGVEILWHRADVLDAVGRMDEAARDLEAAVSVEPNFCRGYAKLADLARGTDPTAAARWSRAEGECRRRASAMHLEENEKWMVEPPEDR
ncbi:MAG TPA: hypothetical protein DD658_04535 [Deltaproteobacteria bacterium]|nr:hypothetical protein [Deltaproteobacteria bacterium]